MSTELVVKKEIEIPAGVEKVWDALTQPEYTKQYMFNCEVSTDWKVGSEVTWRGTYQGYDAFQKGEVLAYEDKKKLTYTTFDPNFGMEDVPENYLHVTYEVEPRGEGVLLTFQTTNFNGDEKRRDHTAQGWDVVLSQLKALFQ